jgi:hypothetical protein
VDEIYRAFVGAVAEQRDVSVEQVLERMADGRVFVGRQAIDAGLADGIATVETLVERMATDPKQFSARTRAVFALGGVSDVSADAGGVPAAADATPSDDPVLAVEPETQEEKTAMNPQEIAAQFAAENPEACALIRAEGAGAERARIASVREQAMPGHEALIEALAFDGKTTGPEAAVQVLAAERGRVQAAASGRLADAPAPVVQEPAAEVEPTADPQADAGNVVANAHAIAVEAQRLQREAKAAGRKMTASEAVALASKTVK